MAATASRCSCADIWPSSDEILAVLSAVVTPALFRKYYADLFAGDADLECAGGPEGSASPGIRPAPISGARPISTMSADPPADPAGDQGRARPLLVLGDSITTDHISPVGDIAADSPAGRLLSSHQVSQRDFNAYGSRRSNHEVMVRGTFANIRLQERDGAGR